ncbi:hypothetical protein GCM10027085_30040 [Spirosoma aerophilum]
MLPVVVVGIVDIVPFVFVLPWLPEVVPTPLVLVDVWVPVVVPVFVDELLVD